MPGVYSDRPPIAPAALETITPGTTAGPKEGLRILYRDLIRTLRQVSDRRFLRVLLLSLILAALLYVSLVAATAWTLTSFAFFETGWLDTILDVLGVLAFLVIAALLFPAFATAIQGIFLDDVAKAVEARWYPDIGEPRRQSWGEILGSAAELAVLVLVVNLMLIPVYLALLFVPPLNLVLFYVVNGFLLGREYFETVALRRLPPAAAKRARRRIRGHVWLAGALIAFMFSVPLLNLAAPVLGTALMMHLFQRLRGQMGEDGDAPSALPAAEPAFGDGGRQLRAGVAGVVFSGLLLGGSLHVWDTPGDPAQQEHRRSRPIQPSGIPEELFGRTQLEVWSRLGSPNLVRREGPARVWQYTTADCVLDLYLFETAEDFEVIHHSLRGQRRDAIPEPDCYARLIERARASSGPTASLADGSSEW